MHEDTISSSSQEELDDIFEGYQIEEVKLNPRANVNMHAENDQTFF